MAFSQAGELLGWYNPLILYYDEEKMNILEENDIYFFTHHFWVDPSARTPDIRQYDLIYISPSNYRDYDPVWDADLQRRLTQVWSHSYQDQVIARLYKINR